VEATEYFIWRKTLSKSYILILHFGEMRCKWALSRFFNEAEESLYN